MAIPRKEPKWLVLVSVGNKFNKRLSSVNIVKFTKHKFKLKPFSKTLRSFSDALKHKLSPVNPF